MKLEGAAYGICDFKISVGPNYSLDDTSEVCSRQRGSGSGRRSGLAVDGTIFEPNDPQLVQTEIPLSRLPEAWDGITIAQLSNFHYDDRCSVVPLRKASDVVNPLCPDLLVVTGDFVQFLSSRNIYITRKSIRPRSSLPLSCWPN